jgi:hypothetical protein
MAPQGFAAVLGFLASMGLLARGAGGTIVGNIPPLVAADDSLWAAHPGVASLNDGYSFPSYAMMEGWGRFFRKEPTLADPSPAARGAG